MNNQGKFIKCRALLDSGSELNFVSSALADKLKLKAYSQNTTVLGISKSQKTVTKAVTICVASRLTNFKQKLQFSVLDKITCELPHTKINVENWSIPVDLHLADPSFNEPGVIDLLIGADMFFDILRNGFVKLRSNLPAMQNTHFGWVISGSIPLNTTTSVGTVNLAIQSDLTDSIAQFWQLEELSEKPPLSAEEKQCERTFTETTIRDSNEYFLEYKSFIDTHLSLGHAVQIERNQQLEFTPESEYYLPHHAVIKPENSATPSRVVFNASMPTTSGKSLNDILLLGPPKQSELFDIILRFRTHQYVMTCDIVKKFRQIRIQKHHQALQKILWRNTPEEPIQTLQLTTVTYGTTCAPYLAQRCLFQLAEDEALNYPLASLILKRDTYMDEILFGSHSIDSVKELQGQLIELLKKGGFQLHKWKSNFNSLDTDYQSNDSVSTFNELSNCSSISKTLGIIWNSDSDAFSLTITDEIQNVGNSKRQVLSGIAQIFDPLGLIDPVTIKAKLLMQKLWLEKLNWDDPIPPEILLSWQEFKKQLPELKGLTIKRSLLLDLEPKCIQLHGFCDCNEKY
ncbi:uncharacterized protein LOC123293128 [Chrysoperla carnea]|uniref:uncharacterized protein LOC123293128 n=1 Tax=Chrysoperla carnea TaxID=189513 RepID=UPI001D08F603|nr:uncharacterized protein LOC123293128 [Chrysoperla carnea]